MAEGMKDSGVEWIGKIPADWSIGKFGYCAKVQYGFPADSDYFNTDGRGIPLVRIRDITSGTIETWYSGQYPDSSLINRGDILVGMYGNFNVREWEGPTALLNQRCCVVSGGKRLRTDYLKYCLPESLRLRNELTMSTTVKHLLAGDIEHQWMPLPSLEEQERITSFLRDLINPIEATMTTLEEQVDVLERYRKSLIHEAVTKGLDRSAPMRPSGIDWIGDIPEGWAVKKLKHLTKSFESGTSVRAAAYPAEPDEKGVLSLSAVFGGVFNPSANKTVDDDELSRVSCPVKGGSLLVSRCNTSEWVGLPAYVDKDYPNLYLPDKLWQIGCGSTEFNRFIWYALQSKSAREYCAVMSVGSSDSMQNIASADLLNMYIALPATQEDRNVIVAYLDEKCTKIDSLLAAKREQIDILKKRRQSLIYEHVTGKRRVGEEV